jgi:hypothetical protein
MIIDRRVRVAIQCDDGRAENGCEGPAPDGRCPRAARDGRVACAGARIQPLRGTAADGQRIVVDSTEDRCPLADLVHAASAPWD